jgi:NAD(P)-dependent dehydrogenase (short-subunit alcohol dehydrogenase family)
VSARVVVTGAASGIGRAVARRFASEGAEVLAVDRDPVGVDGVRTCTVDVSSDECLDAVALFGSADVLVNAAGILRRHPVVDHPLEAWNETLGVNLTAPFRLSRQFAADHLAREAPGVIVNVCSIESFIALPGHVAYTVSKTALLMLTRAFAFELAPAGIRVVGVGPGVTETGMNADLRVDPVAADRLKAMVPLGRFAQPDEIAAVVAFLASEDASYITGSVVLADGGMHVY